LASSSAKTRIKEFLIANIGRVVTAKQLQEVAQPVSEWARRVRELRDEEGWPIITNHDSSLLRPGEYMLEAMPPDEGDKSFQRGISQKVRAEVLDRDGFTCQMCGKGAGELDDETGRRVRLHLGHVVDKSLGGTDEASNLRTLCSTCNQGAKNITPEKPSKRWLLSQVRRAGEEEQSAVYEFLKKRFESPSWHGVKGPQP
jgi:hypothetical protein